MSNPCRVVPRSGAEYPSLLTETPGAPAELYVVGRRLEPGPHVGVVGTRRASRYGLEAATWIGRELAGAGVTVVSGMAAGIDGAAHRGALAAGGATVAVLGNGVDVCYPRGNAGLYGDLAEAGTLVSEYEPGTPPAPWRFPARNRIIAGMSLGVVIIEARKDGGAMITARLAAEFGREVFALPGPVHAPGSVGPHLLLRDGARAVTCARDILEDLGLLAGGDPAGGAGWVQPALPPQPVVSPDERAVLAVLQAEPMVLDRVARLASMPASAATAVLARLVLAGLVTRHPGGRFAHPVAAAGRFP